MKKPLKENTDDWMEDGLRSNRAAEIGRRKPYHLEYAEKYKNDPIMNPHLKGDKNATGKRQLENNRINY